MRTRAHSLALITSLLLLAVPSVLACDEMMGEMTDCSRNEVAVLPTPACHAAPSSELMDCCMARGDMDTGMATGVEIATSPHLVEESSQLSFVALAAGPDLAATGPPRFRWREPARYALFSSYLI